MRGLLLFVCVGLVLGYPDGPPDTGDVCSDMEPNHAQTNPQPGDPPFSVTPDSNTYSPGQEIEVVLTATDGIPFRGFMIQARRVADQGPRGRSVGEFLTPPGGRIRQACQRNGGGTLSHAEPLHVSSVRVTWEAPPVLDEDIEFRVTFVRDYATYWIKVPSIALSRA